MRFLDTRRLAAALLGTLGLLACSSTAATSAWPDWDRFARRFVEPSGRIVDLTFDQKSTSEGQSYGMFFALVANDRARFDAILKWTSDNLAHGELGDRLPAWHWGKRDDGSWGIKDENPAADGELWMAYALFEAARLWKEPRYEAIARKLLASIRKHEVVDGGGAGMIFLPGPVGFVLDADREETTRYRVDPSYMPGFVMRYFAAVDPSGPWRAIWDAYLRHTEKVFAAGFAPDLYAVDRSGAISPDPDRPEGGYDAIRVYLWAGMSGPDDLDMVRRLSRFAALTRSVGAPPEKIDPTTGAILGGDFSPIGYSGAVLPFLHTLGDKKTLAQQLRRLQASMESGMETHYYDQCLILFGKGWLDGAYRFEGDGRLVLRWAK